MAVSPTPTRATTKRSVKAVTEPLAVARFGPDLYLVDNGSHGDDHAQYTVDLREPACTCGDYQYRANSDDRVHKHGCKHIRRVKTERGEIDIAPLLATDLRLDGLLLRAVEGDDG
jgi:hypothetical protein